MSFSQFKKSPYSTIKVNYELQKTLKGNNMFIFYLNKMQHLLMKGKNKKDIVNSFTLEKFLLGEKLPSLYLIIMFFVLSGHTVKPAEEHQARHL